jgi:alanine dehydrogenase
VDEAIKRDPSLARGVTVWQGKLVNQQIADALGMDVG